MQEIIGGRAVTDRYGVIGHPVAHSKSPFIHGLFAEQTGQAMTYEAWDIHPDSVGAGIGELLRAGVLGMNVTVPHKLAVMALCASLRPRAAAAGAVNTLIVGSDGRLEGDNTDGTGLVNDLDRNLGVRLAGARILVLGAGGAARGILPALLDMGPRLIVIANRTPGRAEELATRFAGEGFAGKADVRACGFETCGQDEFDLVINATSAGITGEVPPFPASVIRPAAFFYDLFYAPGDTPFIAWARSHGAVRAAQGLGMLVEQAAESFYLWRGVRPDTRPVLDRLAT